MDKSSEPQIVEVVVNVSGGGKLALESYGGEGVNWSCSLTHRYAVPKDWDEDRITSFEVLTMGVLQEQIDKKNQPEYEAAMESRRF